MKCKVLLLLILLLPFIAKSQNLVPNPSFEAYTECPSDPIQNIEIEKAYPWKSYRQTPDYFHPCDETGMMSSPWSNIFGFGIPFHNVGKGGFFAVGGVSTREIVGVELIEPLVIGQNYFVSFQLLRSFGGGGHSNCDCASNNLGLKFTTQAYTVSETVPIDNFAHILYEDVLTDTMNWTEISGWVVADSAYTHLAIGTFFTNEFITIENYNNYIAGLPTTYYFLDGVCVSTNPLDCENFDPLGIESTSTSSFVVYPNPANSMIQVNSEQIITELNIYDVTGKLLFRSNLSQINQELNISHLAQGLYILVVQFENGIEQNVSFIKQ